MDKPKLNPLPDFGDVLFLLILNFLLSAVPGFLFSDGSTGWHLVSGQYILRTHSIPHTDLISYTRAGAPWVAYEWLFDVLAAIMTRLGGLNALAVFCSSIIALVFLLVYERARRNGLPFPVAVPLMVAGILASSVHWLARPHLFTMLGVYLFSSSLDKFEKGETTGKALLLLLVAYMIFWVNVHPGFLIGLAITGIYLACYAFQALTSAGEVAAAHQKRCRWLFALLVLLFLASLINPYGMYLYHYIAHYLQSTSILQVTNEFQSPVFHGSVQSICLEIIFLAVGAALATATIRPSLAQLTCCLAFAHLALSSVRNAPEFVIVALPFLGNLADGIKRNLQEQFAGEQFAGEQKFSTWFKSVGKRLHNFNCRFNENEFACQMHLLPAAVVILLLAVSCNSGKLLGCELLSSDFDLKKFPSATLDYVRQHGLSPSAGFNFDNWGGYVNYKLGIPVFIDDRLDFYGKDFYLDYGRVVLLSPGWGNMLDKRGIRWILFPKDAPLSLQLAMNANWKLVAQDAASQLFVRR